MFFVELLRKAYILLLFIYLLSQQTLNNSTNLFYFAQHKLNKNEGF